MSFVSALYHIVINTHNRSYNLQLQCIADLYAYITGIVKNHNSQVLAINGTTNHIHILINLHPTESLSTLIRDIKQSSSLWLKRDGRFPKFAGWGKEYFAFSCSQREAAAVKAYIARQREHHGLTSFDDEAQRIVTKNGGTWTDHMLT